MVLHLTADKPGAYTGAISLADMHNGKITAQANRLTAAGSLAGYQTSPGWMDENSKVKFDIALDYESQVLVLHDGGTVEASDGRITFSDASSLTILINAGTDYVADRTKGWRGENPHDASPGNLIPRRANALNPCAQHTWRTTRTSSTACN